MATHSSIPDWRIPRTEDPGGLQAIGSQRVGHHCSDSMHTHILGVCKTTLRSDDSLERPRKAIILMVVVVV